MNDLEKIKRVMNCFGKNLKIGVKQIEKTIEVEGWICLTPYEMDVPVRGIACGRTKKATRWLVEVLKQHIGNRDTPPDIDIIVVAEGLTLENACKRAWELISANAIERVLEQIEYDEMAAAERFIENSY